MRLGVVRGGNNKNGLPLSLLEIFMPRQKIRIAKRKIALDARPDRLDLRDLPFRPRLGTLPARWPSDRDMASWLPTYVKAGLVLDQGDEGACTGFGLSAVINYQRFTQGTLAGTAAKPFRASPAMLYDLARLYDEWPGEDYEGSSCRGALKGWHRHGVCRERLWPYMIQKNVRKYIRPLENPADRSDPVGNWDVDALGCTLGVYYRVDPRSIVDMQAAILETGAIYCSATAHEGWDVKSRPQVQRHADLVAIAHVSHPQDEGVHAFALVGYNELGFVVQNSWGKQWGSCGFALLPYEAWVAHGEDAWVFTLGAARATSVVTASGKSLSTRSPRFLMPAADVTKNLRPERPVGLIKSTDELQRHYSDLPEALRPIDADCAYLHSIVLDRGFPVRNDVTEQDALSALRRAAYDRPLEWLRTNGSKKLLIYAHGGLNSEAASVSRIRALTPYATTNGIYPLFITWRTGAMETVSDLVEEFWSRLGLAEGANPARGWVDRLTDKTDRILEPLLRTPGGALWQQMKLNAVRASEHADGGCRALVTQLEKLREAEPQLEIHLIGHSAGAVVLGAMLTRMRLKGILKAASLRLFAPACTTGFALEHYMGAVKSGVLPRKHWHIHTLSDANERNDNVGPYRKSLLYLVSRSFEDTHKMPLLGLHTSFDGKTASADATDNLWAPAEAGSVREWAKFWSSSTQDTLHVLNRGSVSNGVGALPANHGCFDNAVDIMGDALGYVLSPNTPKRVRIKRLVY